MLHERNNKKLSIIGVNVDNFISLNKKDNRKQINDLLNFAKDNKINFISVPYQDQNSFEFFLSWEKTNNYSFVKSILINLADDKYIINNNLINKNRNKEVDFQYYARYIKTIIDNKELTNIDFLSLLYSSIKMYDFDDLNEFIKSIKMFNPDGSFGIHCKSLTDALVICKKVDIDHLEITVDINTSFELLNSLFKISQNKQIAVFCFLETNLDNKEINSNQKDDSLTILLSKGKEIVNRKIISNLEITEKEFPYLVLRKYIDSNFQSILVHNIDLNEEYYFFKALTHPYLTNDEQSIIQNSLQLHSYESPKNH